MSTILSIESISVILNGHTVEGWSDDNDALSLPEGIELANVTRGADGRMVGATTGNKGGQVRIKLQANSPSTKFFMGKLTEQIRGAVITYNGTVVDSRLGTSVRLYRGVMMSGPMGQTIGKGSAPNREFIFEFESVIPNYAGANISAVARA